MNNLIKLVVLLVLITGTALSQVAPQTDPNLTPTPNTNGVYQSADVMPSFKGGNEALGLYLQKNLKYPATAKDRKIQGKVMVTFVVNGEGKVKDVKVLNGLGGGCNEEAIRIVQEMPDWTPGQLKNGSTVPVQFYLPIQFKLDDKPAPMK